MNTRRGVGMDVIVAIIIACEIGFWAVVVLGLVGARYLLRWPRLGTALLTMTLVIDLILLTAVILNLQAGGATNNPCSPFFHGLAAVYLGVSIAYGRKMIGWADVRFARRFADAPAPSNSAWRTPRNAGTTSSALAWQWSSLPASSGCRPLSLKGLSISMQ